MLQQTTGSALDVAPLEPTQCDRDKRGATVVVYVVPFQDLPVQAANGALVESSRETASKHNQVALRGFMMFVASTSVAATGRYQGCQGRQTRWFVVSMLRGPAVAKFATVSVLCSRSLPCQLRIRLNTAQWESLTESAYTAHCF